jgi:glutamine synthetase
VVFGWDSQDVCYDNTQVTGWQHGFPDALARIDLDTARHVPWDNGVPFFLGEFVNADGSPPLARTAKERLYISSASWRTGK